MDVKQNTHIAENSIVTPKDMRHMYPSYNI